MKKTTLQDVVEAFEAIAAAQERYRQTLRKALADGETTQTAIGKALDRTREALRQDAMSPQDRQRERERDAARRAARGVTARKTTRQVRRVP